MVGLEILGDFSRGLMVGPLAILTVLPVIGPPVAKLLSEFVGVFFVYVEQYVIFSIVIIIFFVIGSFNFFRPCWLSSAPNGMEFLNLWNQVLCLHAPYNTVLEFIVRFGLSRK